MRILLLRGHADTNRVMKRLLTMHGHEVDVATSIQEAEPLLNTLPYDVLISGIELNDGNGWEFMKRLHDGGNPVRGVALTGYGMDDQIRRSFASGFSAHLVMPADLDELLDTLTRVAAGETVYPKHYDPAGPAAPQ